MNVTTKKNDLSIDLLTIMAIGVVSFILKNVIHEALGHGGACHAFRLSGVCVSRKIA